MATEVQGKANQANARRGTGPQSRAPQQLIADPLATPFQVRFLEHQDGPLRDLRQLAPRDGAAVEASNRAEKTFHFMVLLSPTLHILGSL